MLFRLKQLTIDFAKIRAQKAAPYIPPATTNVWPETQLAAGEAR